MTRLGFPLANWGERRLSGNVSFAAGTEDFTQIDQIGRFASQTYGGELRIQINARQDVTVMPRIRNAPKAERTRISD